MECGVSKLQVGILALAAACAASAVPRYIGVISAEGGLWVDSAGVSDHATVFEGSIVETTDAPATVQIGNTVRVLLDANSRAQVYADHLLLERGRGQLDRGSNYRLEARTLRVMPGAAESRAVVAIKESGAVEVGSLHGDVRVTNADGVRVANVEPGNSVALRLEQGRDAAILTGCVAKAGRAYLLRDEVSAVIVELRGAEMASQSGKHVQVTGQVVSSKGAVGPADFVVQAAKLKVLETGCATTAGPAGSSSRARVIPTPHAGVIASGLGGPPQTVIAGVGVTAGHGGAVNAVQSHGHRNPHRPHKPPISKGR
jgi:hypothetical protein